MKLSVIIVNYNVRAYLEQCLRTVQKAMEGIDGDVFVVDNLSTDGSVEMVREKFPQVKLIANAVNVGFSRANNQAIRESASEYVLLLNPDTVVGEDVFHKVLEFLDAHPKAGGLGVKMIDGRGRFLPESKRGLPTPAVAFYKIIGLTRLFPRSRVFGRYHLGHLPENAAARIEILSGACMFLRKKTLDEVGLLDESFFMYGEDIDLSYRITLGGYENWYLPEARIIHYKGESTKKSSVNYVFVFYNAMAIFAKKHFTHRRNDLLSLLITGSIYLSAAGAIVARFLRRALLPLIDTVLCVALLMLWWEVSPQPALSAQRMAWWALGMLASFALFGAYDRPVRLLKLLKGVLAFGLLLLVGNLLAGHADAGPVWRTVSAMLGALLVAGLTARIALHLLRVKGYGLRDRERQRVLAVGSESEAREALALLWQTHFGLGRQERLSAEEGMAEDAPARIRRMMRRHGIDELVFCAKDLAWGRIIFLLEELRRTRVMFKIAQPGREFIIGPNSIESLQDMDFLDEHTVSSSEGRRTKRIADLSLSAGLLLLSPILIWFIQRKSGFFANAWQVLVGKRTWVGYASSEERPLKLPVLRRGVLTQADLAIPATGLALQRANVDYAKDYGTWRDVRLVLARLRSLGRD